MAIRTDLSVNWEVSPRIITVASPSVEVAIQDLHDTLTTTEASMEGMDMDRIVSSSGKEALGSGVLVGITLQLLNAKLAFEARGGPSFVQCNVGGGNLVAVDSLGVAMDSVQTTAYVQVIKTSSSSATIQSLEIEQLKYMIESQNKTHQGYGETFYLDPVSGSDANSGTTGATAVKTFAVALALCTSGRGDVIYILSLGEAQVSIDERWVINKASIYVRGPGRGVILKPVDAGGGAPTISIEANEVSLSGFIVEASTADATAANAIDVWSNFSRIENMWINRAKNGVRYCAGDYHKLRACELELHAENGILVEDVRFGTAFAGNGAPREIDISDVPNIYLNTQNGIKLVADTVNYSAGQSTRLIRVYDSNIELNTLYGMDIGTGVYRTLIRSSVSIYHNTSGNILDNGTETYNDGIWDKAIADHLTAGTTGKALSDAGGAGNPWGTPITGNTDAGTFGELVGKKILTIGKFLGLK